MHTVTEVPSGENLKTEVSGCQTPDDMYMPSCSLVPLSLLMSWQPEEHGPTVPIHEPPM